MKKTVILTLLLGMVATFGFAIEPGEKAPDFKLTDQNGQEHALADFAGKTLVLEWTNPYCPFVIDAYKRGVSKDVAAQYADNPNVVYVLVNSTAPDHENFMTAEETKTWYGDQGVTFPVLADPTGDMGRAYGAKSTPHVFVVDGEGVVRYAGALDSNQLNRTPDSVVHYTTDAIAAVVAGKDVAEAKTKQWGCSIKYAKPAVEKDKVSDASKSGDSTAACCALGAEGTTDQVAGAEAAPAPAKAGGEV